MLLSGVTHINATLCAEYSKAPWHPPNCPVSHSPRLPFIAGTSVAQFSRASHAAQASMPANIVQYNERMASVVSTMAARGKKVSFHDVKCASPLIS
eukprot:COSAG04_NODE_7797_length_1065_cov_1.695652_3_plen_96_part_00